MANLETSENSVAVEEVPEKTNAPEITQKEFEESMEETPSLKKLKQSLKEVNEAAVKLVENVSQSITERTRRGFLLGSLLRGVSNSTRKKVRKSMEVLEEKTKIFDAQLETLKTQIESKKNIILLNLFKELEKNKDEYLAAVGEFYFNNYSEEIKGSGINERAIRFYDKTADAKSTINEAIRMVESHTNSTEEITSEIATRLRTQH